jgi:uncharacterized membrane protein
MRILMPATILCMILSLWLCENKRTTSFYEGVIAFLLLIVALVITLTVLVPIDNNIKEWTPAILPADWEMTRNRWKSFHAIRTFASVASFACFVVFVLGAPRNDGSDA